ncbi:hypothetical protein N7530_002363 [Penicillium desertorum]|uniref:Uncharacterized protein n=1 Tax=Penicillium desertorum TaxID=1303715 RepID=A0A9W9X381_9EURO|nr:hypothetical protein N7530_012792 [Penicillium desertorum]KAJ5483117.1 hypothetical protein N7530_002363 [Penicillium desertorum]
MLLYRHPPLVGRVCRESRLVATKAGHYRGEKAPPDMEWYSGIKHKKSWIDLSRDSIHLNWTPWCEPEFWHEESAVHHLAWHSAKAQGASFMFGYLKDKWDDDVDMENRVGAAKKLQHGTIVMRVIVAHTTVRNAFGDAPIQLVDISDDQRLDAFFAFAEECESYAQGFLTKGQRFYRESLESIKTAVCSGGKGNVRDSVKSREALSSVRTQGTCALLPDHLLRSHPGMSAESRSHDALDFVT